MLRFHYFFDLDIYLNFNRIQNSNGVYIFSKITCNSNYPDIYIDFIQLINIGLYDPDIR